MGQADGCDVVLRALGQGAHSIATLLEQVLGLEPVASAHSQGLPAVVISGTSRAHADIAAGLLRDAGAVADVIPHGAPLDGPRPRARRSPAIREVVEERSVRHRDAAAERPAQPVVAARAPLHSAPLHSAPQQAPAVVAPVFPEPAPSTGAGLLASTPMIDFLSHPPPAAEPLPAAAALLGPAFGDDSAFGPLDLDAARPGLAPARPFDDAPAPARPAAPMSQADAELESLFQAPGTGYVARVQAQAASAAASVQRAARARLTGDTHKATGQVALLELAPRGSPWLKRGLLAAVFLGIVGLVALWLGDGGDAEAHAGTAEGDERVTAQEPAPTIHPLLRLSPTSIQRPMGMILRRLVDGIHPVQIDPEGLPEDTQCLLVRMEDGKGQARLTRLLRTGLRVPMDAARADVLTDHAEALRVALNDNQLKFSPLCLSVDAWIERATGRAQE